MRIAHLCASSLAILTLLVTVACAITKKGAPQSCIGSICRDFSEGQRVFVEIGRVNVAKPGEICFTVKGLPERAAQTGFLLSFEDAVIFKSSLPSDARIRIEIEKKGKRAFLKSEFCFSELHPDVGYFPSFPGDHPINKAITESKLSFFYSLGLRTGSCHQQTDTPEMWYEENGITLRTYSWETVSCYQATKGRDLIFRPAATYEYVIRVRVIEPCTEGKLSTLRLVMKAIP
jgi:hypothetical protein